MNTLHCWPGRLCTQLAEKLGSWQLSWDETYRFCRSRPVNVGDVGDVGYVGVKMFSGRFLQHRSHERLCRRRVKLSDGACDTADTGPASLPPNIPHNSHITI